ncbi:hypothetical protein J6590_043932 [Homalodisca vitripennis]|nr:hypothetical protein J6590_043932 [Homalodisca vitripennis]
MLSCNCFSVQFATNRLLIDGVYTKEHLFVFVLPSIKDTLSDSPVAFTCALRRTYFKNRSSGWNLFQAPIIRLELVSSNGHQTRTCFKQRSSDENLFQATVIRLELVSSNGHQTRTCFKQRSSDWNLFQAPFTRLEARAVLNFGGLRKDIRHVSGKIFVMSPERYSSWLRKDIRHGSGKIFVMSPERYSSCLRKDVRHGSGKMFVMAPERYSSCPANRRRGPFKQRCGGAWAP